jgi:malate dehydrogenase (oxaloacetate-decarboxylating)(NADP+)
LNALNRCADTAKLQNLQENNKRLIMSQSLKIRALAYHAEGFAGKIAITSKPVATADDLSLAYSPGVAEPCLEIAASPENAYLYTNKANLVAVISNGTAVLGLGNIGALASKPVMEGKAALFKRFAGIDSYDIEIDETDPDKLIQIIAALHPTFGAINLEDIKAPECFYIERELKKRLPIPVFHDDQHGTAIVVVAGMLNALKLTGRKMDTMTLVVNGAGAAAIACLNMLQAFGLRAENTLVVDSRGVIHTGRTDLSSEKQTWAQNTAARSLTDAMVGADAFLGLSAPKQVTQAMVQSMARQPIVFALANPEPEIRPEQVYEVAPDAIVATGRSDYPNQINNALCFPYLFRAALDTRAPAISEPMKQACAKAIAALAADSAGFGKQSVVPNLLDERLFAALVPAIKAAV